MEIFSYNKINGLGRYLLTTLLFTDKSCRRVIKYSDTNYINLKSEYTIFLKVGHNNNVLWPVFTCLCIVFLILFFYSQNADSKNLYSFPAPVISIDISEDKKSDLVDYIWYWKEDGLTNRSNILPHLKKFQPIQAKEVNFGFTEEPYWLAFKIKNTGIDIGDWVLYTSARSRKVFTVYQYDGNSFNQLTEYKSEQSYDERPNDYHVIVANMAFSPQVENWIFIRTESTFTTRLELQLLTKNTFIKLAEREAIIIAVFLAMMLSFLVINLSQYIAVREPIYFYYAILAVLNALYVTQQEGYNFQFLWPYSPRLDDMATLAIGLFSGSANVLAFRASVKLKAIAPEFNRLVGWVVIIQLSAAIPLIFGDVNLATQVVALFSIPMTIVLVAIMIYLAFKKRVPSVGFYTTAWLCFASANCLFLSLSFGGSAIPGLNVSHVLVLGIILEALFLLLALSNQVRILRMNYDRAQSEHIELLNSYISDMKKLQHLQMKNDQALKRFRKRIMEFASSRHDLYQPIQALKLGLECLKMEVREKEQVKNMESALHIAEKILQTGISDAKDEWQIAESTKLIKVDDILRVVIEKNRPLANRKKIDIRYAGTYLCIQGDEAVFLRVMDNLLGNAVRYTERGTILVGARRKTFNENNSGIVLQVYDTGIGMAQENISRLMKPFQRENATGEYTAYGLGLSIVKHFCDQFGYQLTIQSQPGKGSVFSVFIPHPKMGI